VEAGDRDFRLVGECKPPMKFIDVPDALLSGSDQRTIVRSGDLELAVFVVAGKVYAIDNTCPHAGSSLLGGRLNGLALRCPTHGLTFDLASVCMRGGGLAVRRYPVNCDDGVWRIEIGTEGTA
jgi:3-phenylpropionate/trans-cinnamate dioxygenase ferredoxin component